MTVFVCSHYVSFEGEIGEVKVFADESKAKAWVAEYNGSQEYNESHSWRDYEGYEVE